MRIASYAIVPAAGHSRRMGEPKLLLPLDGSTIIEQVIAAWNASAVSQVILVIRPKDERLAEVCRRAGVDVVVPEEDPPEMKDSVALGLAHVREQYSPQPDAAWLLAPADIPHLATKVIDRLLTEHVPERPQILAPIAGDRRGHPVLFPWALADEVSQLAPTEGVNALLSQYNVREIPVDEAEIGRDIDTPEDYRRLLADVPIRGSGERS